MERDTRLQGIFAYLSKPSHKFPKMRFFSFLFSKGPKKRAPLHVPQSGALWKQTPEPYLTYVSGSPVKKSSLQAPLMESLGERCPIPTALPHSYFRRRYTSPPSRSQVPLSRKGANMERNALSGAFINISSRVPSKGVPSPRRGPLN
jgi:hypothetical protein